MTDTKVNFVDTPEFKEAVAKAASEAAAVAAKQTAETIMAQIATQRGAVVADLPQGEQNWAAGLAMALANLTDQNNGGRKRVSPEVIKRRADAADLMMKLIIDAKAEERVPLYTLRNKIYLDEALVEPIRMDPVTKKAKPTKIGWPGVPNEAMVPANDTAREIFAAYCDSIGNVVSLAPKKATFITAGGLTINGTPPARRGGMTNEIPVSSNGLQVEPLSEGEERAAEFQDIRILGTVAPPARQTA